MSGLKVFNTLTKKREAFSTVEEGRVRMYVCGPTVYDHCHIGHGRVYSIYDAVYRYLQYLGYEVNYTRNLTDIDDKIIERANREGVPFTHISETYTASFHEDMRSLGLLPPVHEPKATETIAEMIEMIQTLIEKDFAYAVQGDVYFRVEKKKDYGKLSGKKLADLRAGARVETSRIKENPMDFVLWKGSKPEEPSWESPWGKGRPGWHIECSAMSKKFLGEQIDLHTGGLDLIFPHHENEIAQSECASGKIFSSFWLHNGFVNMAEEKMSKSLGNTVTLKDLLKSYMPEAVKLFLLSTHYRKPIQFSSKLIEESEVAYRKLCKSLHYASAPTYEELLEAEKVGKYVFSGEYKEAFENAMNQDFNTAKVIGVLFSISNKLNELHEQGNLEACQKLSLHLIKIGGVLGFDFSGREALETIEASATYEQYGVDIEKLVAARDEARKNKDYAASDRLRDELKAKGYEVLDTSAGTQVKKI